MKANNNINEWIEKAEGDFQTVVDLRNKKRKIQQYIIAFHCQQCIEKYLKALLTYHKIEFPKQHDLEELLSLLLLKDGLIAPIQSELKKLTPYAVQFRYPGDDVSSVEVTQAVKSTKKLRAILRRRLGLK